jgi:hypothetical protein
MVNSDMYGIQLEIDIWALADDAYYLKIILLNIHI